PLRAAIMRATRAPYAGDSGKPEPSATKASVSGKNGTSQPIGGSPCTVKTMLSDGRSKAGALALNGAAAHGAWPQVEIGKITAVASSTPKPATWRANDARIRPCATSQKASG